MDISVSPQESRFNLRQPCDVRLALTLSDDLLPGDAVEAQFPNSWLLVSGPSFTRAVQAEDPDGEHFISVSAQGARFRVDIRERHLNHPEGPCRHGRLFAATLEEGRVLAGAPIVLLYANTYAPYVAETEALWLRVKGHAPAEAPTLRVLPGPEVKLRVIAPSGAEPGQLFDVLVVSLDKFDNASCTRRKGAIVRCDGKAVAENLEFEGAVRVPVSVEEEGVFRFRLGDAESNAVRVAKGARGPYWGDIHIHTKLSHDAQGAAPYGYARDVAGLDFAAACDHWMSLGPEGYRIIAEWAREANEPGRFVTIPAHELNPPEWTGHHNVYFSSEEALMRHAAVEGGTGFLHPDNPSGEAPPPDEVMVIPHHTGILFSAFDGAKKGNAVRWDAVDDRGLRPAMEIYSHHGQSDMYAPQHVLAYEFNRMRTPSRRANVSVPGPHYAQDYWTAGRRVGVIASSDEHSGQGGRQHGGIAAVWAGELTRQGVFDAIRRRRTYATTGERMLVEFDVDGLQMGEEGDRPLGANLPIRLRVWGTALLLHVEILRFRPRVDARFEQLVSVPPRPESKDAAVDIEDTVEGPAIYYARAAQEPLEWPDMAWTSPVWVGVR